MEHTQGVLKFPKLFEPLKVGSLVYKNRIFAAPTMMSSVTEGGRPTEALLGYYREKARGGAAQVTIGDTPVDQEHAPAFPGMYLTKANMAFLGELAYGIRQYGAVPSFELNHAGFMGNPQLSGHAPFSSVAFTRGDGVEVLAMTEDDMKRVAENYAKAAYFVKQCGFQAALLHGGHGWLLAQFLSPLVNTRDDRYGGSAENRARFPRMVIEAVREAVGRDFVLEYRISGSEYDPRGLSLEHTIPFIQSIQDKIDLVHVSGGLDTRLDLTLMAHPSPFQKRGCNVWLAEAMKKAVDIPVVTVGGIGSPAMAEEILQSGKADVVALCRALIADPYWPQKARAGRDDEISPCTRCLHCRGHMDTHKHFSCAVNPRTGREMRYPQELVSAPRAKKVLVVGGGPGGMKAAAVAAARGHKVTLADRNAELGGQLRFSDHDPIKADLRAQKDYLARMTEKNGVELCLGTEVTREWVAQRQPEVIVVAAGAKPRRPELPGMESPKVIDAPTVYAAADTLGERLVLMGGGLVGIETAVFLADKGKKVTVVTASLPAKDANRVYAEALRLAVAEREIEVLDHCRCLSVTDEGVLVRDKDGIERVLPCEQTVNCLGMESDGSVYAALWDMAPEVYRVGDCVKPGTIWQAIATAYYTALDF